MESVGTAEIVDRRRGLPAVDAERLRREIDEVIDSGLEPGTAPIDA